MTDVLLTHSYFMHFDPKQARAMMPYPPLGTLYAASVLESAGYRVELFDTMLAHSELEVRAALERHRPKMLVIYDDDFNYLTKMCLTRMREAAFIMSRIGKEFGTIVVVHGSDASDHHAKYLAHGADAVMIGECETTLSELCGRLICHTGRELREIDGLVYTEDGVVQRTHKREINNNLDSMPFPAWHLVDHERYRTLWTKRHGYYSVNMVTTRGCPYHCNWCAKPIYGQVYHARSPENVVEELRALQRSLRPDHIWFADDIFGLKPGWVQRFSSLVRDQGIRIRFKIQSRADLLSHEDTVAALASAGCAEVWIGAESGSQKILDAMEKGTTVEQIASARSLLGRYNIKAAFFLQFGYLGETAEDIGSTIRMVKEQLPDDIGISVSYPLPGTKFYEKVKSDLTQKQNWIDSDDLAMMYRSTFSPAYYKRLHRYVHKTFRIHQGFHFLGELFRFHDLPTKKTLRRIASLGWYLPAIVADRMLLANLAREPRARSSDQREQQPTTPPRLNENFREPSATAGAAFSAQAPMFDDYENRNPILQWMRMQVHRQIDEHLRPGDSILDINAGTGIDAIRFARLGHPVVAIDVAGGMIVELQKKVDALDLAHLVQARQGSYTDLDALRPAKFHHVVSNFGGLNCIADLGPVAEQLAQVLHPGGYVTLVIMPAVCPWELLHALAGNFSLAFRRLHRNGTLAHVEGHHFLTYYHSPSTAIERFGTQFRAVGLRGLASASPPPYMESFPARFPRAYRLLTALDTSLASYPPFNRWADHYILTLRYTPANT
jgi:anaerobic magnesium-protoporphyrin IX monomethyl ester cyclase